MIILQICRKRGSWESKIIISLSHIYEGSGLYAYHNKQSWGVHRIIINKKAGLIHFTATSQALPVEDRYVIEKKSQQVKREYDLKYLG